MSADVEGVKYARTACLPCRRSKRRCDKKVPTCDLCVKKEVDCSYPSRQKTSQGQIQATREAAGWTPDTFRSSTPSAQSIAADSNARAIYFLAPQLFQQARLELPQASLGVPSAVSAWIGDASSIRNIATTYFRTIHRWFSIVSRQGFFIRLLNPLAQRQSDLSLLAVCMKLCCSYARNDDEGDGSRTGLYRAAKSFHHEAEISGPLSIHTLQAGLLIACYELGQAVYPAAYLTVGACARYGLALGIDKLFSESDGVSDRPGSWNEVEEERRAWWAVLMFDRLLSLGNPTRSLSTEEPTFDTYLPVDDTAFDDWQVKPGNPVTISAGFTLKMGSFARLSQATFLLNQALRSIHQITAGKDAVDDDETAQLRRTLLALVHAADNEAVVRRLEFCAPSAVCFNAILLLQEQRSIATSRSGDEHDMSPSDGLWDEARTALDRLAAMAVTCTTRYANDPEITEHVPFPLIHVLYQVARIILKMKSSGTTRDGIETLKNLLGHIDTRWRLAGVYLNILKAQEMTMSLDSLMVGLPNGSIPASA